MADTLYRLSVQKYFCVGQLQLRMKNIFDRARLFFCKDKEFRSALYQIMGFCPHNIDLYRTAFAHKSHEYRSKKTGNKPLNNERLEFLGDAVLETVVSHIVYRQYPNKREGFLTNTRSKIVSRESLGKLAKELGIDRLIQSQTHGRTHNSYLEGNSFEALMGAIYLDRGFRYAFQFIEKRIIGAVLDLDTVANKEVNFKSKLLEWKQKNRIHLDFVDSSGNNSNSTSPSFHTTVVIEGIPAGEGKGFSKKESHQAAAKDALTQMRRDADFLDAMFRAKEKRTAMGAEEFFALPHISEIDEEIAKERSAAKSERNNNRAERKNERKNEKNARDDKRNERKHEKEERKEEQKEERKNERREERQNAKNNREERKDERENAKNNREERNPNAQPAQKNREEQSVQQPQSVENENRKPAKARKSSTPREPRPTKGEVAVEKKAAIAEPEKTEEAFVEVPTQPVAQAPKADNAEVEPAADFGVAAATLNAEVVSNEDAPTLIPIEFVDLAPESAETHDVAELDSREEPTVAELDSQEKQTAAQPSFEGLQEEPVVANVASQEKQTVAQPSLEDLQKEIDNWVEAAEHACEFAPTEKTASQEVADVAQENAVILPTEVGETVETVAAISKEQDAESVNEAVVSEPISDGNAVEETATPETATPVAEATTPKLETTSAETAEVVVDDSKEVANSVEAVVDADENAPRVRSEQEKKRARRQNKRQNAANFANTTLPPAEQSHRAQKATRKQEEQAEKRKEENRKRQVKKMQLELAESFKLDVDIDDFVVVETAKSEISPAETAEQPNTKGEEMRDEKRKNNRSRSGRRPNNRRRGGNRSNTAQGEGKRNDAAATDN